MSLLTKKLDDLYIMGNSSIFGLFLGLWVSELEGALDFSTFNDIFLATFFMIGIWMIILSLLGFKKETMSKEDIRLFIKQNKHHKYMMYFLLNTSIKDKIIFYIENEKYRKNMRTTWLCMFLCSFIFIFILNIFLILCGWGVTISTLNLTAFFYTLFCKVVLIRIVVTLVISAYTKKLSLNSFSLSVSSIIFIFILGGIYFYCTIPFVKFIATNMFYWINLFIEYTGYLKSTVKSILEELDIINTVHCSSSDCWKNYFENVSEVKEVLPFSNLSPEEISEMYSLSDSTTPCEVNEDEVNEEGVNEEVLPFSNLSSEEISEMYSSSYSTTVSELTEEELVSSVSSEEISEILILPFSSYTTHNSSSTSDKQSLYWSNNPSSSGKNTVDNAEKLYFKDRLYGANKTKLENLRGAFLPHYAYEDYVTSRFKSCRTMEELNKEKAIFLDHLESTHYVIHKEIKEDSNKFYPLFDNSLSLYANEELEMRRDLISHLNSQRFQEYEILRIRSSLVHDLYDIHNERIIDLINGYEPESSEPEGSETEGSETDDSYLTETEDTKNTSYKGKGKQRDTDNVPYKGKKTVCIDSSFDSDYSPESAGDNNPEEQEELKRAMEESRREHRDPYSNKNGESSKRSK